MKRTLITAALAAGSTAALALPGAPAIGGASSVDTGRQALTSYNATHVPAGATAKVRAVYTASGSTVVTLHVWGLAPNREYGAHAHRFACSPTSAAAAGGHFQYAVDPVQPSTDPAYANPWNEVWLDLTTDGDGNGSGQTVVRWQPPNGSGARPASVILHDHHTATGPAGSAGTAGPRYGCLTVAF
ncbi:MAG TPA: superoxide dismutase [Mycobacteriales bacterium]|nr:superoxide dismutase [Mycobacteriales bacterium]